MCVAVCVCECVRMCDPVIVWLDVCGYGCGFMRKVHVLWKSVAHSAPARRVRCCPVSTESVAWCLSLGTCVLMLVCVWLALCPRYRCALCDKGFFRIAGKCRHCPNNPWLLIVGFLVIVLFAAVIGYLLNRKSVNIAFLSIGVDYFQVLAMFSRSNVKWPKRECSAPPPPPPSLWLHGGRGVGLYVHVCVVLCGRLACARLLSVRVFEASVGHVRAYHTCCFCVWLSWRWRLTCPLCVVLSSSLFAAHRAQ
jgi:hypothetical protein